jgi:hypothetical protein
MQTHPQKSPLGCQQRRPKISVHESKLGSGSNSEQGEAWGMEVEEEKKFAACQVVNTALSK